MSFFGLYAPALKHRLALHSQTHPLNEQSITEFGDGEKVTEVTVLAARLNENVTHYEFKYEHKTPELTTVLRGCFKFRRDTGFFTFYKHVFLTKIYKEEIEEDEVSLVGKVFTCKAYTSKRFSALQRRFREKLRRKIEAVKKIRNFYFNHVLPRVYNPHLEGKGFLRLYKAIEELHCSKQ